MKDKERIIDKLFSLVCRIFDAIDPETRKEKKKCKICKNYGCTPGYCYQYEFFKPRKKDGKNIRN